MAREPGLTDRDTIVAVTTISFDIAGLELYLPLVTGAKVVLAGRHTVRDGFALVRLVESCGATVLQATPTLWQMLVEAGLSRSGLKMLCGGEPLPKALASSLLGLGGELWNMYGPTETTIWSSVQRIEDGEKPITIGHPIANTQLLILDKAGRVAAIGVAGELHIGGEGLANGYFARLDLTEKAFVDIDIGTGTVQRLYKTGTSAVGSRMVRCNCSAGAISRSSCVVSVSSLATSRLRSPARKAFANVPSLPPRTRMATSSSSAT